MDKHTNDASKILPHVKLWIDFETYSSNDIVKGGSYKYFESFDFEILMMAYAFDDEAVTLIDLCHKGESFPKRVLDAFKDPNVKIYARNAQFERLALRAHGIDLPADKFRCTAGIVASNGLPLNLEASGKAVGLDADKAKDSRGKALIRYFSLPCKPSKVNGMRYRNLPYHDLEKWAEFCDYCKQDVEADRNVYKKVLDNMTANEWRMYVLDQKINDRGVLLDMQLVHNAITFDEIYKTDLFERMVELTGLSNPNSVAQLKAWLSSELDEEIKSLNKESINHLINETTEDRIVNEILNIRRNASKTSVKKYTAMVNCICEDGRAHGLFQYLGAMRTGRWAGRLIQLQNLPKNEIEDLEEVRTMVRNKQYSELEDRYPEIADVLSQLIRTALIAPEGMTNAVADFSAIEARIIAWLAGEKWRIDVFDTHGMIYEASASMMFGVPIESIQYIDPESQEKIKGENYDMRAKGKVAELALGYQGGWRALETMGGSKMGLSQSEMEEIVKKFRKANPNIVSLWYDLDRCAIEAVKYKGRTVTSKFKGIKFKWFDNALRVKLPSGRQLTYWGAHLAFNRFDKESVKYYGVNDKKQWAKLDTYGGKLTENIVQAIARDCLVETMLRLDEAGFNITMHVHDEIVCEVPEQDSEKYLKEIERIMSVPIDWADDLNLTADGYVTPFYKKD